MSDQVSSPLQWIRLECLPLPDNDSESFVVFWNPQTREVVGEAAEKVLKMVDEALQKGHLQGATLSHFEITDPLSKPSELAAVLAQYFWVVPQPVEAPGDDAITIDSDQKNYNNLSTVF